MIGETNLEPVNWNGGYSYKLLVRACSGSKPRYDPHQSKGPRSPEAAQHLYIVTAPPLPRPPSSPPPPPQPFNHSMPLPPLNDNNDHAHKSYSTLLTHLHPSPPTVLEIDILHSPSFGPDIQYSAADHALGIPKRALISAFLVARGLFFAHLSSPRHGSSTTAEEQEEAEGRDKEEEALKATSIILLLEPNHSSAINFRKRCILRDHRQRRTSCSSSGSDDDDGGWISRELIWLESLLTSPLPKHTKSPTLWAHRGWVLRMYVLPGLGDSVHALSRRGGEQQGGSGDKGRRLIEREMGVVMSAGERHPRNYYGWNYAREVCELLAEEKLDKGEVAGALEDGKGWRRGTLEKVRRWCFLHPRDISGWSFFAWLLEEQIKMSGCGVKGEDILKDIVVETEAFVEKYEWRGESIEWFLKAVRRLRTHEGRSLRFQDA